MKDFSYITNSHPSFIEGTYNQFLQDPNSIDPELKKFFEGFDFAMQNGVSNVVANPSNAVSQNSNTSTGAIDWTKEINVYRLILGYRNKAHLIAKTNPIRERKDRHANLELEFFFPVESSKYFEFTLLGLSMNLIISSLLISI